MMVKESSMNIQKISVDNKSYLECLSDGQVLRTDADILDLVAACGEHLCDRLMVHAGLLPTDFYDLKTGLAGNLLQKLVNYRLRCAFILDEVLVGNGRFSEMMIESNRGEQFHFCFNVDDARKWLVGLV
jgi:PadR family transcriptional regulator, regulatory protein AphA